MKFMVGDRVRVRRVERLLDAEYIGRGGVITRLDEAISRRQSPGYRVWFDDHVKGRDLDFFWEDELEESGLDIMLRLLPDLV